MTTKTKEKKKQHRGQSITGKGAERLVCFKFLAVGHNKRPDLEPQHLPDNKTSPTEDVVLEDHDLQQASSGTNHQILQMHN